MIEGRQLSAPDYHEVIRQWTQRRLEVGKRLQDLDVVIAPTTMIPAAPLRQIDTDLDNYLKYNFKYMRNTSVGNILNLCSVSLPCGFNDAGLPVGLLIYTKPFQEDIALRVAYAYEQATDWNRCQPDLSWAS